MLSQWICSKLYIIFELYYLNLLHISIAARIVSGGHVGGLHLSSEPIAQLFPKASFPVANWPLGIVRSSRGSLLYIPHSPTILWTKHLDTCNDKKIICSIKIIYNAKNVFRNNIYRYELSRFLFFQESQILLQTAKFVFQMLAFSFFVIYPFCLASWLSY